jgi:RimJ/RimL family protein N-acetyltransferase
MIVGVFPEHLRADAATFHHIMQTAPREDLEVGDVLIGPDDIAELDQALLEAGRLRWTALMRDSTGACVGGTEVTFEHWEPNLVLQQNTGIDPAHRGLGLAKWAKAAMLERIRHDRPEAQRIRTGNAFSNVPMLAINDALGFRVIGTRTEWQSNVDEARRSLSR